MGDKQQRLDELLRRQRRARLAPKAIEAWAAYGVSVSVLSADRQAELIAELRAVGLQRSGILPDASTAPLSQYIDDIAGPADLLVVVGWGVDEEPAVLVTAEGVSRCTPHLRRLYPDGFVMFDQPATLALIVDFDEDHPPAVYVQRMQLPSSG
jgi:hypothetical protein